MGILHSTRRMGSDALLLMQDVKIEYVVFTPSNPVTPLSSDNIMWTTFKAVADRLYVLVLLRNRIMLQFVIYPPFFFGSCGA